MKHRDIGTDRRGAVPQGLGRGQAVAFGEAGKEHACGALQKGGDGTVREAGSLEYGAVSHGRSVEAGENGIVVPTSRAADDKAWTVEPKLARHFVPDIQQQRVVLAGFNRSDNDKIRLFGNFTIDRDGADLDP